MTKIQKPNEKCFGHLDIGICLGFVIWKLGFYFSLSVTSLA